MRTSPWSARAVRRPPRTRAWQRGDLASLDLETTGLDPAADRIVEVALVLVDGVGHVSPPSFHALVDPGVPVPDSAVEVHGITSDRARTGLDPAEALNEVARQLDHFRREGIPLVIYNEAFDWRVLRTEARRHAIRLPAVSVVDPLAIERHLDVGRWRQHTLSQVAAYYGVPLASPHSALSDAVAAERVLRAQFHRFPELASWSIADFRRLQSRIGSRPESSRAMHDGRPVRAGPDGDLNAVANPGRGAAVTGPGALVSPVIAENAPWEATP